MKKKLYFLWIDDDPRRKVRKETLERKYNVNIGFYDSEQSVSNVIQQNLKPDLILIDHKLVNFNNNFLMKEGPSLAKSLKNSFPSCPIVCITAVPLKSISVQNKYDYDRIIEYENLSEHYTELESIVTGFKTINDNKPITIKKLIKLLKVPQIDEEKIEAIIPDEIRQNYNDARINSLIYKWIINHLINRSGPLLNRSWVATLLGIKETSLDKVKSIIKSSIYKGIFANGLYERWWQSELKAKIYSMSNGEDVYTWDIGRKLKGIKKKDYSVCWVCEKNSPPPEVVAYSDETAQLTYPMHLSCTIQNKNFENLLFFEEVRMTKPDEDR